jgi:hypothetical protein
VTDMWNGFFIDHREDELHDAPVVEYDGIVPLHHLALVFREDLSLHRPVREFLAAFATSRDREPEAFGLEDYLDEVWPDGVPSSVYAANIGNDPNAASHFLNLLLRPVCEGPTADRPAIGGLTLALAVQRRKKRLEVRRVEVSPHVRQRDFEVTVSAPIYWRDHDLFMDNGDMATLAGLPFHRATTRDRLLSWRAYLDWKEALIRKNQISIPYLAYRWESETIIAFLAHEDDLPDRKLIRMELGVAPQPRQDEDEENGSRKRRRRDPRITEVGEVEGKARLNLRSKADRKGWGDIKLTDKHGRIVMRVEEERAEFLRERELPSQGLLMSSIAGDLAPLRNQRSGVDRLNNDQGFSPRLADFVFSSSSASVPVHVPEALPPVEGGRDLNEGQRKAVARALTAPDLCLIQGPPGTGKTTVIADICLRAAIDGKRVLVASQTNLAVDNALARLSDASAVRPLRLGNPDRVDEEFKHFLAENVIERWFTSIGEQCRTRMRAAQQDEEALVKREEAVARLEACLDERRETKNQGSRASRATARARKALDEAKDQLEQANAVELEARRTLEDTNALVSWGMGERGLPPSAAGRELPETVPVPDGLDPALPALVALDRVTARRDAILRISKEVDAAMAGSAADPAAAEELRALRAEKLELIDSDEDDDLLRLKTINRKIKSLQGSGWNNVTGSLHRAAREAWPDGPPDCIALVVDALKPSKETKEALVNARGLVQGELALADTALEVKTLAAERWLEDLEPQEQALGEKIAVREQSEAELTQAQEQVDTCIAAEEAAAQRQTVIDQKWESSWSQAMPDTDVPAVTARSLERAQASVAEHRAGQGDRLVRAKRWRGIQKEWLERLGRVSDSDREQLQTLYIRRSNVVGMTTNEAGKRNTWQDAEFRPFDIIIVDEVSKATPPELILPLLLGEKAILVGDHRQLPPMFRERDASFGEATANGEVTEEDYNKFRKMVTAGLFEELFEQAPANLKSMLWTQYRMHPTVMEAVNQFYEGRLEAGPDAETLASLRQHHLEIPGVGGGRLLSPKQHLLWIDSSKGLDGKPYWEDQAGSSKLNQLEVNLVVALLVRLGRSLQARGYGGIYKLETTEQHLGMTWHEVVTAFLPALPRETVADLFDERRIRVDGRALDPAQPARAAVELRVRARKEVGVITFYGAQLKEIRREIDRARSDHAEALAAMDLRTNTVDRFQGMEKPIIIASLVRSKPGRLGDFVREYQRINVGLSRAQQLLVVIGAEETWKHAMVPLPPIDGGPAVEVPAYRNILELARRSGGRRVARQVLFQ